MLKRLLPVNLLLKLNSFYERLCGSVIKYRWPVIIIILLFTIFFAYQTKKIYVDNSFESYFLQNDNYIKIYNEFKEIFGSDVFVYITFEANDLYTLDSMRLIKALGDDLQENVPFVKKDGVTSLVNVEYMETVDDELKIYELMGEFPKTNDEIAEAKRKIMGKPIYLGNQISRDGNVCSFLIEIKSNEDLDYMKKIHDSVNSIIAKPEYRKFEFRLAGSPIFNTVYANITMHEFQRLFSITILLITILLYLIFKKSRMVFGSLCVIIISLTWTMGFMALAGWPMRISTTIVPPLLISISIGDTVHILSEFRQNLKSYERNKALTETLKYVGVPCMLTSLTTAAGFSSLCIAPIQPIFETGFLCSFGVITAFLITVIFLPAFFSFGKINFTENNKINYSQKASSTNRLNKFIMTAVKFADRSRWIVLPVSILIIIFSIIGLFKLKVETSFLEYFDEEMKIKKDYLYIDSHMGGSTSLQIVVDSKNEDGIKEPSVLKSIETIQEFLNSRSEIIGKTMSVIDLFKDIKKSLKAPEPDKLPGSKSEAAQYLLLYEQSGGKELSRFVDYSYSKARIDLRVKFLPVEYIVKLIKETNQFIKKNINSNVEITITGLGFLGAKMVYYMVNSQIFSLTIALIIISLMMSFVFASIRIGLISMIPNILPILLTLGLMGWTGKPLDFATLMIGCIAIGIAVDDTIHFFNRFIVLFKKTGNTSEAVYGAAKEVGRALFLTTMILTISFAILYTSPMKNISSFGYLSSFTIVIALIADLILGPVLLLIFKPLEKERIIPASK